MKKFKLATMAVCLIAALGLTSCIGNDDDQGLSPIEKQAAFNQIKGSHTGKMIYLAKNPSNPQDKTDTLDIEWHIDTDSTMTIKRFPVRLVANGVADEALKKALDIDKTVDLDCSIGIIKADPVTYLINPTASVGKLTYDGKEHEVALGFYGNDLRSFGTYNANTKVMQQQIVAGAVIIDRKDVKQYPVGITFMFLESKGAPIK